MEPNTPEQISWKIETLALQNAELFARDLYRDAQFRALRLVLSEIAKAAKITNETGKTLEQVIAIHTEKNVELLLGEVADSKPRVASLLKKMLDGLKEITRKNEEITRRLDL